VLAERAVAEAIACGAAADGFGRLAHRDLAR
jgi:hypothetical protein